MSYQNVVVEKDGACVIIKLNRPKANALSLGLINDIRTAVEESDEDTSVRSIVITAGGRFFSAGADVPTIQAMASDPFQPGGLLTEGVKTMNTIEGCSKPVIAAVNGVAVGGGCELILACHIRIAAESAKFGQPEVTLGIVPGWGGTFRLPRLIGESRAMEWILTGRIVTAQEAYQAGLVCKVVPDCDLMDAAKDLARLLAGRPRVAVGAILTALRERAFDTPRGAAVEADAFAEAARSKDAAEGVAAFIEKRQPNFTGE